MAKVKVNHHTARRTRLAQQIAALPPRRYRDGQDADFERRVALLLSGDPAQAPQTAGRGETPPAGRLTTIRRAAYSEQKQ